MTCNVSPRAADHNLRHTTLGYSESYSDVGVRQIGIAERINVARYLLSDRCAMHPYMVNGRERFHVVWVHAGKIFAFVMKLRTWTQRAVSLFVYPPVCRVLFPIPVNHSISPVGLSELPVPTAGDWIDSVLLTHVLNSVSVDETYRLTGDSPVSKRSLFRKGSASTATAQAKPAGIRWVNRGKRRCVGITAGETSFPDTARDIAWGVMGEVGGGSCLPAVGASEVRIILHSGAPNARCHAGGCLRIAPALSFVPRIIPQLRQIRGFE